MMVNARPPPAVSVAGFRKPELWVVEEEKGGEEKEEKKIVAVTQKKMFVTSRCRRLKRLGAGDRREGFCKLCDVLRTQSTRQFMLQAVLRAWTRSLLADLKNRVESDRKESPPAVTGNGRRRNPRVDALRGRLATTSTAATQHMGMCNLRKSLHLDQEREWDHQRMLVGRRRRSQPWEEDNSHNNAQCREGRGARW